MKILIIEDTPEIAKFLKSSLEDECFAVDWAKDGEAGSFMARTNDYNLILLDFVLPKKNGNEVCQEIRQKKPDVYIIAMSVKSEVDTKVDLLETGVDDYLIKPFAFAELKARIHALLRRPRNTSPHIIQMEDFELDTKNHLVKKDGQLIYLTRKESMILEILAKNKGQIVSRTQLLEEGWDINVDYLSNALEMHMRNLRKKLGDDKKRELIKTFPGRGYMVEK